jgi:uncharacterized protein YqcC (DUF446 family)
MSANYPELKAKLAELEKLMRELQLWSATQPPAQALASQQPFALDTLSFEQWLQFVFIPRLSTLVENRAPLPTSSGVAPMAEAFFSPGFEGGLQVVQLLRCIDELLTAKH